MEFISTTLLQKYESIIDEINKEYDKSQQLKEVLKQENDSIVVYNLVKNGAMGKLSHLDVKIFNNNIELLNLYGDELSKNMSTDILTYGCSKYYLVEVYITKQLLEKLTKTDWIVIMFVKSDMFCTSKSVNLPKKSSKIIEVIPLKQNVIDCTIEAYLINTKDHFNTIKLDSIDIDISYYFCNYKRTPENKKFDDILQLTKLYSTNLATNFLNNVTPLVYEINVPLETQKFVETFLNHAYHSLDIELFSDIYNTENKKDFILKLEAHNDKIEILFNRKDVMQIKAKLDVLQKIKKYLLNTFHQEDNNSKELKGIMEVKNSLLLNLEDAINLYKNTRKISSLLPV